MNSSDKIKNAILAQYKSVREFSNIVGIPNSTLVSALDKENGIGGMAVEKVVKICEALNLDIKTFDPIQETPLSNFTTTLSEQELLIKYRQLDTYGKGTIDYLLSRELDRYKQFKQQQTEQEQQLEANIQALKEEYKNKLEAYMRRIPYGGTANEAPPIPKKGHKMVTINRFEGAYGAGSGQYNDNTEMVTIEVPEDELPEGADTTMDVAGDSMEPTISNGDTVYIQHTNTLDIGDIGVFYLDGECFIKEYGDDELISHNAEYAPIQIKEFSTFVIQGKVLGKKIEGFVAL